MVEQASTCEYRVTCHFFNMKNMTPDNKRFKEIYCVEWPLKCPIYQARTKRKTPMTRTEKLHNIQDFIIREVQKNDAVRVDVVNWAQDLFNSAAGIHLLEVFRGGEKSIFTFTEYELFDNYGSNQWEKQLRSHVNDVLTEL